MSVSFLIVTLAAFITPMVLARFKVSFLPTSVAEIIIGIIMGGLSSSVSGNLGWYIIVLGIALFGIAVLFQVITLPVEFNASRRALALLREQQILVDDELGKARKVLQAAALTYVAATAQALANLLRLLLIVGGRKRDD